MRAAHRGRRATRATIAAGIQPSVALHLYTAGANASDVAALWPQPDATAAAHAQKAAPSLAAHVARDDAPRRRRRAPADRRRARCARHALRCGGDAEARAAPLAGLLADPAGWLRSADSVAASPLKIQGLFDALPLLLGVAGKATRWRWHRRLARCRRRRRRRALALAVDPTLWTAAPGATARLSAGVAASSRVVERSTERRSRGLRRRARAWR
jgi:hypothetical protein